MPSTQSSCEHPEPTNMDSPLITEGYVCPSQGSPFELRQITLPSMTATMVEVEVLMSGLCHTELHMRDNDWGTSDYPLCAGHEGVALVKRIGSAVRTLREGDRVSISWIRDSCRSCDACVGGRENICERGYQGTYLGTASGPWGKSKLRYNEHGGCFARIQRIEELFAVKIPAEIPSEMACPLLCGGGTVFEALCNFTSPKTKVGVAGIGGLGTAAIKLGRLKGCIMYALSSSPHKKEGALAAGAMEFVCTANEDELMACAGTLDVILDTRPVNVDVSSSMDLLKINGTFVHVGIPPAKDQTVSYDAIPLIFQQKKIAGSIVTGTMRTKQMLDLVSKNLDFMKDTDIWKTEQVPMSDLNEVMKKLEDRSNKGYRYILEW